MKCDQNGKSCNTKADLLYNYLNRKEKIISQDILKELCANAMPSNEILYISNHLTVIKNKNVIRQEKAVNKTK